MSKQISLQGKRIAIMATNGFEQSELTSPRDALLKAGADVRIVSLEKGQIQGYKHDIRGDKVDVNFTLDKVNVNEFDALILPGGVINPDTLRTHKIAVHFIQGFDEQQKCIAAICHAPQLLIEAAVVKGRNVTSFHSIRTDLVNAGANWQDQAVVIDGHMITSRNPKDLDAFNQAIITMVAQSSQVTA